MAHPDGEEGDYLERGEITRSLRLQLSSGTRVPVLCSDSVKMNLSYLRKQCNEDMKVVVTALAFEQLADRPGQLAGRITANPRAKVFHENSGIYWWNDVFCRSDYSGAPQNN